MGEFIVQQTVFEAAERVSERQVTDDVKCCEVIPLDHFLALLSSRVYIELADEFVDVLVNEDLLLSQRLG